MNKFVGDATQDCIQCEMLQKTLTKWGDVLRSRDVSQMEEGNSGDIVIDMWLENKRLLFKMTQRVFNCVETGMAAQTMESDQILDFESVDWI